MPSKNSSGLGGGESGAGVYDLFQHVSVPDFSDMTGRRGIARDQIDLDVSHQFADHCEVAGVDDAAH